MNKILLLITVLLFTSQGFSHGEDKPGPNQGFIQMPGAFHTEVVPQSKNSVQVYLLDIAWKNPTIKDSSVKAQIGKESVQCAPQKNFFICQFSDKIDLKSKSQLKISAVREKAVGNEAIYELPLKLAAKPVEQEMDHSQHH